MRHFVAKYARARVHDSIEYLNLQVFFVSFNVSYKAFICLLILELSCFVSFSVSVLLSRGQAIINTPNKTIVIGITITIVIKK
jgi:hypothetical protein